MASRTKFDEARRKLDEALAALQEPPADDSTSAEEAGAEAAAPQAPNLTPPAPDGAAGPPNVSAGDGATARPHRPVPPTETLARLLVGAALLGLDGLATRSPVWEAAAGIERPAAGAVATDERDSGHFRHALIGWVFETEERLRPQGNPIQWLRTVATSAFAAGTSVVIDLLPLPRLRRNRSGQPQAEPSDEETRRWVRRGLAEAEPSRRFAQAALEDLVDSTIRYLARRPAVQEALVELARSPAMDEAVAHIAAGPAIERAVEHIAASPTLDTVVAQVGRSPALDDVVARLARSPALEEAVSYLAGTKGVEQAIETISRSPALSELVNAQSTSVAAEILEEVRERGVSGDIFVEGLVRRLLRRQPRSALPPEARGLLVELHHEHPHEQEL